MNSHFSAPGLCLLFVFLSLKALTISDIEQKQLVENFPDLCKEGVFGIYHCW